MAHFYFHVRQRQTLYEDRRGGEFPDLKAAWDWAEFETGAMIREQQLSGSPDQCWMEIWDTTGTMVATLPFVRVTH
jgi:hypothetical protein